MGVFDKVIRTQRSKNLRESRHIRPNNAFQENKCIHTEIYSGQSILQALEEARPGDGVGYPNLYTGQRMRINNAFLKRCKLLRPHSQAFRLNAEIVIKIGDRSRMSEAAAMRLLSERTSLPIPKVHDAYVQEDGCGVVVM